MIVLLNRVSQLFHHSFNYCCYVVIYASSYLKFRVPYMYNAIADIPYVLHQLAPGLSLFHIAITICMIM